MQASIGDVVVADGEPGQERLAVGAPSACTRAGRTRAEPGLSGCGSAAMQARSCPAPGAATPRVRCCLRWT